MAKIDKIKLNGLEIAGYEDDYVFETIKKDCDFYEKGILEKWTPYLKESKGILDIGANLGNHTLYWATEMPQCKIYSFEPYLPTFTLLKENIELNNLENVTAYNKGVGKKKTFAHVTHVDEKNMGATTLEYSADDSDGIEIIDIDSLVRENEIEGIIDFVKIDTEGFEVDVLRGMESVLHLMHPDIWVEVGADTCIEVLDILERLGYCAVDMESANILFLSKERHFQTDPLDKSKVIQKMLYYYQRTNDYYALYNTVKENLNTVSDKNKVLTDNYNRLKEWHESGLEKIKALQQQMKLLQQQADQFKTVIKQREEKLADSRDAYERLKQWRENDQKKLIDVIKAEHQQMLVMEKAKRTIQKQQTEIQLLHAENESYKQKLSVIYNTWYGKLAMKCYNFLKKVKRRLTK